MINWFDRFHLMSAGRTETKNEEEADNNKPVSSKPFDNKFQNLSAFRKQPLLPVQIGFGLTPILEDLDDLRLSSNQKRNKDDF
jgi:hypothetical protein